MKLLIAKLLRDCTRIHECATLGKTARMWRRDLGDGTAYVELRCGHPCVLPLSVLEVIGSEDIPDMFDVKEKKERKMPQKRKSSEPQTVQQTDIAQAVADTAATAANGKPMNGGVHATPSVSLHDGNLVVTGYEKLAFVLKAKLLNIKLLEEETALSKESFRGISQKVAAEAAASVAAGGKPPTQLSFPDGTGGSIVVKLPKDMGAAGNYVSLTSEALEKALESGVNLIDGGYASVESTITLSGTWVDWFKGVLASWEAGGVAIPDGWSERSATKLTPEGYTRLRELASTDPSKVELFEAMRKMGTRAPSVGYI